MLKNTVVKSLLDVAEAFKITLYLVKLWCKTGFFMNLGSLSHQRAFYC